MAKKSPANSNKKNSVKKNNATKKATAVEAVPAPVTWQQRLGQEVVALLLLGLALFVLLALASYSLADPQGLTQVWSAARVGNWGGKAGAFLAWGCIGSSGWGRFSCPCCCSGWPGSATARASTISPGPRSSRAWPCWREPPVFSAWRTPIFPGGKA